MDPNDRGDDKGSAPAASAAACAARCLATPICFAYTFTRVGRPVATCWLKGAKATEPAQRESSPGHTSGVCRSTPPPPPPAPYVRTGAGRVAFEGLGAGEAIYGMGEHRGGARCTNQCVNSSLPMTVRGAHSRGSPPRAVALCTARFVALTRRFGPAVPR